MIEMISFNKFMFLYSIIHVQFDQMNYTFDSIFINMYTLFQWIRSLKQSFYWLKLRSNRIDKSSKYCSFCVEELFHAKNLISLLRNFGHIALYKNILRFEIPSHSIHFFFKRLPLLTKCGFQSFCYMYDRIFFFCNTILLQNLVTHSVHPTIFFSILSL